ncbi:hypothetical protein CXB51_022051 [Gossypium anomalum]|uniref:Aminotransferase-like plant mobile domain-containing protein n=1 Tax=Gossypium anomalum TaxID=47600 RepID=A0A8J6CWZ5_9ROSI|nr:hypothetical protein CXB51_022051 [Gossypium anomalum]
MAGELIRLDNKHISVDQMIMSVGRVLQCYICNMFGPPSPLIENYLQEAEFRHVATIDVHLQLGLPVDGYAVTGSTSSTDWGAICYELLGAIMDKINEGWIKMGWLRDTFPEPDNDSNELESIRYAWAYILEMIGGYLMPNLSRNLVHLRWLLKLVDFRAADELSWGSTVLATLYKEMCGATRPNKAKIGGCLSLLWNHSVSYVGIPTSLEDIQLLLDQRSKAEFQWTPYEDPTIRVVIPDEFFQNPNFWHVKVPLVNYATVEIHQSDRDPWQAIFIVGRGEATTNSCLKGTTGPFKSKKKGRRHRPINDTHTIIRPNSSIDDTHITAFSDYARLESMAGSSPFSITLSQPPIHRPPSHEGSHEAPSGSSSFYQSLSPYEIQTHPPWVTQTPPQSLFYQGGSPSQQPQPDPLPEEPQSSPEADRRRNPARTRRRPSCGTDSDRHGH